MKRATLGRVLALLLVGSGCGRDATPGSSVAIRESALAAVPHPDLDLLGADLSEQIRALRDAVEDQARGSGEAWGQLGRAYHAYEFYEAARASYSNASRLEPEVFAWPYSLALLERDQGKFQAAVEHFREALALDPDSAVAQLHLGEALIELNDPAGAEPPLAAAGREPGLAAAALAAQARGALNLGDSELAVDLLQRALQEQPDASALRHSLAAALRQLGDDEGASKEQSRAGARSPFYPDPLANRISDLEATSGALVRQGARALAEDRPEEAVERYRQAVAADPDDAEARRQLALALHASGELDRAVAEIRVAAGASPASLPVHFDLANLLLAQGHSDQAIEAFERCLELDGDHLPARFNLANVLLGRGRLAEALVHLEKAVASDPTDLRAAYLRAMAKDGLGRGEEAIAELEGVVAADPSLVSAQLGLAGILERQGSTNRAAQRYELTLSVAEEGADIAQLHAGLGRIAKSESRVGDAIDHYRTAVDADPANRGLNEELAAVLESAGRFEEAAPFRRRLVEIDPGDGTARLREAIAWVQAGRIELGRERLEEGVTVLPDDLLLLNTLARLLATAADAALRDGRRSLEIAERLYSERPSLDFAETLAMAYAELGSFTEAAAVQKALIRQVRGTAQEGHLPRLEANLERYENGVAVRM